MINLCFYIFSMFYANNNIFISMNKTAEVKDTQNVMLGEVSEIKCENSCSKLNFIKISSTNGYITRFDLEKALENLSLNYEIKGKVTKINQNSNTSIIDDLTNAVVSYVLSIRRQGNPVVKVEIMNLDTQKFRNVKNFELEANNFKPVSGNYYFNILGNNKLFFEARVDITADVLSAKNIININEDFSKFNVLKTRSQILYPNLINSMNEIKNLRSVCTIQRGELIKSGCLNTRPLVLRNEIIKLEIKSGNITLSTNAKALNDANLNEIIEVINLFSNEKIKARVSQENTVEVNI